MSKYTKWYDAQNETTKAYLDAQPIWHDKDLAFVGVIGLFIGLMIGLIL